MTSNEAVTPGPARRGAGDGTGALAVALVVEQLRRPVAGGVGTYIRGLLRGLADRGEEGPPVDLELVASRAPGPGAWGRARTSPPPDPLEGFGVPVRTSHLPGVLMTRAWSVGLAGITGAWDVVHTTSLALPPVRRGPSGRPAPLVVTVHDLAWRRHPEATTGRGRRWHEASLRRALRRARAFVVPSDLVASDLVDAGAHPDSVVVVPEGCDHLPPPDTSGAAALLRSRGVDGPYLLTVGTQEPRKNLSRLAAAYGRARPSLPEPWPLVVVGPVGWGDPRLRPAGDAGGAAGGVVVVGAVPDAVLAALYAGARVFASVPLTEGYGLPPLEAMAFGTPVVASTGVPSIVLAPGAPPAALQVPAEDVAAIATALVQAAVDGDTRSRLAAAGPALARLRTWRRAAAAHVDLWASLS